ncbi:MAG TPA: fibronectin type III domain-containing protein, partial [Intrasporangium sp.]|nr:fibronectin type III domain-containing protein [Intrasporangium sp.]
MSTAATKRRIGVVSTVVVALVAGLLVWVATRSDGEVVRKADLNDGGIWVTNADQARFGRINKAAGQLDAGVLSDGTPGLGLDVFQDGAAVVGLSKASNQLVPINPAEGTLATPHSIVLPKAARATGNRVFEKEPVDLRGGTIAMIDPAKGELRAQRVDNRGGIAGLDQLQTQAKPLVTVGANATVAVGVDGTAYALSGAKGVLAILKPSGRQFAKPVLVKLGFATKSAQVTAVGPHWVVYDSGTGMVYSDLLEQPEQLSVGRAEAGKPAYAALQQPGPDSAAVLVQDESQLVQVPLTDEPAGPGVKLVQGGPGSGSSSDLFLSAPVRL